MARPRSGRPSRVPVPDVLNVADRPTGKIRRRMGLTTKRRTWPRGADVARHIRPEWERVIRIDSAMVLRAMSTEEPAWFGLRLRVKVFRFTEVNRLPKDDALRVEIERQLCGQWRQARSFGFSLGEFATQHGTTKKTLREVFARFGEPVGESDGRCELVCPELHVTTIRDAIRRHKEGCPVRVAAAKQMRHEYEQGHGDGKPPPSLLSLGLTHGLSDSTVRAALVEVGTEIRPSRSGYRRGWPNNDWLFVKPAKEMTTDGLGCSDRTQQRA